MESWVVYSIFALIALGVMNFLVKFASGKAPVVLVSLLFYAFALLTTALIFAKTGFTIQINTKLLVLLIVAGALASVGLLSMIIAFSTSPAVKVMPIVNLNTLVTVALAIILLSEKLTPKIGFGIFFALLSIYLLTT